MKIKYNNLLTITPIFFTISLVFAFLNYNNEQREVAWGIQTKAESIAITSTIFIEHLTNTQNLSSILDDLDQKFHRILLYGQAKRFYISENGVVVLNTDKAMPVVPAQNINKMEISEIFTKGEESLVTIHSPIKTNSNGAALSIDIDVSAAVKQLDEAIYEMLFTVLSITMIGLIASYLLSKIVIKKIQILNTTANDIASGNYSHDVYQGSIREFTDLGDTLNIMKSIMKEIIFKTKNSIIEEEKFRSEEDIIDTYNRSYFAPKHVSFENISLSIFTVGETENGYMFDAFQLEDKIYGYMGKVTKQGDNLETSIKANTVRKYVSHHLKKGDLNLALLQKMFNLSYLEIVSLDARSNLHTQKIMAGGITQDDEKLEAPSVTLTGAKDSSVKDEMQVYLKNYQDLTLQELISDINILFSSDVNTTFILIKNA